MFQKLILVPGGEEEIIYDEVVEYGIACNIWDLKLIVERLDKYLKKMKVRSGGLIKKFGESHFEYGTGVECCSEWLMTAGHNKVGSLTKAQGYLWHFELAPNRHYHIDHRNGGGVQEVFAFPKRQDLYYTIILFKRRWFYECQGEKIYVDSDESRQAREVFFQGLLDCIGFPLEVLHVYDKMEERIFR